MNDDVLPNCATIHATPCVSVTRALFECAKNIVNVEAWLGAGDILNRPESTFAPARILGVLSLTGHFLPVVAKPSCYFDVVHGVKSNC